MSAERLQELLASAGTNILADLPYMTDAELFGLYLFLTRLVGG